MRVAGQDVGATVVLFMPTGARIGVFTADGRLLGAFDERDHAEAFLHPGSGRYLAPVIDGREVGK